MQIKFEHSKERLTRRTGLVIVNEFGKRLHLGNRIDEAFGAPGSNRGKKASVYIQTLVEMMIDGAMHLEDVRSLENDSALQELTEKTIYPSSDAIGDWLRKYGGKAGQQKLWSVIGQLLNSLNNGDNYTLDIDTTLIEADKGDGKMSYKGITGYQPLLGIIAENGLIVGSEFRYGNESPQAGLVKFTHQCENTLTNRIRTVRSDSAAYQSAFINDCFKCGRLFTITADLDVSVRSAVKKIAENAWQKGINADGTTAKWEVAETVHTMEKTKKAFRLVVKRTPRTQADIFDGDYAYWSVATNFPIQEKNSNEVILFHQKRGEMERLIGELKSHFNLDHLPCGQFDANALYFTAGVLAYNIVQLIKQIALGSAWMKKSIRSLRYHLLHLAARVIHHARSLVVRVVAPLESFELLTDTYYKLHLAPWPPS